ncbi:YopX family protein [Alistipes putredinis]|uniref:YopX family protein n=1 Tax=Alistipes putredinis TaxID=28117 RepID=UPI003967A7FE
MREIRYRGIGIAERKWVFGSLWFDTRDGVTLIWSEELKYWVRVDPATVGQYTGLKDMHSAEIYEGDIIGGSNGSINGRYWPFQIIIEWDEAACGFNTPNWGYMDSTHFFEIKGNIHDNPELIEKQTAERHKNKNSMFKKLDYQVFPSEEKTICVVDDPVYGGAHCYAIQHSEGFSDGKAKYVPVETRIQFVQKNDDGSVINGVQSEQLAYILLDRAIKLNNRFPSPQNEKQIAGLRMFLEGCEERVRDRMNRGVMGDLKQ